MIFVSHPKKLFPRPIWASSPTSGYISKGTEIRILKRHLHVHCSISTIAKIWKQSKCHSVDEWRYTHTHIYNVIQPQKRKSYHLQDESGRHYARWNNLGRERNTAYVITYIWNLKTNQTTKKFDLIETKNRMVVAGTRGNWNDIGQRVQIFFFLLMLLTKISLLHAPQ